MPDKPLPGGTKWNGHIIDGKLANDDIRGQVRLLRDDIDELRIANTENAAVLNFLLLMTDRLDRIKDCCDKVDTHFNKIREIGEEYKDQRTGNHEQ